MILSRHVDTIRDNYKCRRSRWWPPIRHRRGCATTGTRHVPVPLRLLPLRSEPPAVWLPTWATEGTKTRPCPTGLSGCNLGRKSRPTADAVGDARARSGAAEQPALPCGRWGSPPARRGGRHRPWPGDGKRHGRRTRHRRRVRSRGVRTTRRQRSTARQWPLPAPPPPTAQPPPVAATGRGGACRRCRRHRRGARRLCRCRAGSGGWGAPHRGTDGEGAPAAGGRRLSRAQGSWVCLKRLGWPRRALCRPADGPPPTLVGEAIERGDARGAVGNGTAQWGDAAEPPRRRRVGRPGRGSVDHPRQTARLRRRAATTTTPDADAAGAKPLHHAPRQGRRPNPHRRRRRPQRRRCRRGTAAALPPARGALR